jgi:hypothetical protein
VSAQLICAFAASHRTIKSLSQEATTAFTAVWPVHGSITGTAVGPALPGHPVPPLGETSHQSCFVVYLGTLLPESHSACQQTTNYSEVVTGLIHPLDFLAKAHSTQPEIANPSADQHQRVCTAIA